MPFELLPLPPPAPELPARVPALVNHGQVPDLPGDITVFRAKLTGISNEVGGFRKAMDGLVFGVGADGVISGIPIVGDVLSGLTTGWLLSKASQVKMTIGDRLVIFGFGALDVGVGSIVLGIGNIADLFFRAHAWNADRIQRHIDTQLDQITAVEAQLAQPGTAADHHTRLTQLRDGLFRGGKTQKQVWARMLTTAAACAVLLAYCAHQQQLRHERIQACQARDGWFCEWRY
jgi:hypothetical protein